MRQKEKVLFYKKERKEKAERRATLLASRDASRARSEVWPARKSDSAARDRGRAERLRGRWWCARTSDMLRRRAEGQARRPRCARSGAEGERRRLSGPHTRIDAGRREASSHHWPCVCVTA